MKLPSRVGPDTFIAIVAFAGLVILTPLGLTNSFGESGKPSRSSEERHRLGERMYREGILPSGVPMQASNKEDIQADSTAFACVSCHMRGGLGSVEGGITTPPATGNKLFQPAYSGTILASTPKLRKHFVVNPARRPAYTEKTLAVALRSGMNPVGRKLDDTAISCRTVTCPY
jgi:hypothetical protein